MSKQRLELIDPIARRSEPRDHQHVTLIELIENAAQRCASGIQHIIFAQKSGAGCEQKVKFGHPKFVATEAQHTRQAHGAALEQLALVPRAT
jgi:hypothetical protein